MWKYLFQNWQKEPQERWQYWAEADKGILAFKIATFIIALLAMLFCLWMSAYHFRAVLSHDEILSRKPQHERLAQPLFNSEAEIIERIQQVVKKGGDLNRGLDEKGQTLLHIAASSGYNKAVKLLIENGANLNAVDADGMRPVERAFLESQTETWLLLEGYGGRIKPTN